MIKDSRPINLNMSIMENQGAAIRILMLLASAAVMGGCTGTRVECSPAALGEEPGKVTCST